MSALKYWLWLARIRGLKNQTRLALLRHFGSPEDLYFADEGEILLTEGIDRRQADLLSNHSLEDADRILGECQRLNVRILTLQDAAYPGRLRDIFDPPCILYVRGHLPVIDEEAVISVVGTRDCTPYGIACAERICYGLATGGCIVATGLAKGIDTAAARGALLAGGPVLGLLGCGIDVVYPKENAALYEDVAAVGALITEYPPGTGPMPGNFPLRNRILSGISVGTLVVEAPVISGALITASLALEQGRDVFAVPGPIDAPSSRGCNRLIRDGAGLVSDAREILSCYTARFPKKLGTEQVGELPVVLTERKRTDPVPLSPGGEKEEKRDRSKKAAAPETREPSGEADAPLPVIAPEEAGLTDDQIVLLRLLDAEAPMLADDLIDRSDIPTRRVLSALTVLEIDGFVRQHSGKRFTRLVELKGNNP